MDLKEKLLSTTLPFNELLGLLYEDGVNTVALAKLFSVDRHEVSKKITLDQNVRTFNIFPRYESNKLTANCYICKKQVPEDSFPIRNVDGQALYFLPYCSTCQAISDKNPLARNSTARLIATKEKNLRNRLGTTACSKLPFGYLSYLYEMQRGLCFYTSRTMELQGLRSDGNIMSIDRLHFSGSYSYDNIVLCINRANMVKHDMTLQEMKDWAPNWYAKVIAFQSTSSSLLKDGGFTHAST